MHTGELAQSRGALRPLAPQPRGLDKEEERRPRGCGEGPVLSVVCGWSALLCPLCGGGSGLTGRGLRGWRVRGQPQGWVRQGWDLACPLSPACGSGKALPADVIGPCVWTPGTGRFCAWALHFPEGRVPWHLEATCTHQEHEVGRDMKGIAHGALGGPWSLGGQGH